MNLGQPSFFAPADTDVSRARKLNDTNSSIWHLLEEIRRPAATAVAEPSTARSQIVAPSVPSPLPPPHPHAPAPHAPTHRFGYSDAVVLDGVQIILGEIPGATYETATDWFDTTQSAGHISGGDISDAGGETIDVAVGVGVIKITDSDVGENKYFNWAATSALSVPTDTTRYVGVEYNAGTPQIVIRTTENWDYNTEFPIGEVVNENGTLHILNKPWKIASDVRWISERWHETVHIAHVPGGNALADVGTMNVSVTAGTYFCILNRYLTAAVDTSGADTMGRYYRDGVGGFTVELAETQWEDTLYDDNSGVLQVLGNNRWANRWFYQDIEDGDLSMLYGQGQYTSSSLASEEHPPSSLPTRLEGHATLLGRMVFQKSAGVASVVQSAFETLFVGAGTANHNDLGALQGGAANEYYHLDATDYAALTDVNAQLAALHTDGSPTFGGMTMSGNINMGGNNIVTVGTVDGVVVSAHAARHENAGADEIDVTGLSGLLADAQTPAAHTHDGDTLQLDNINSDGGAFAFDTTGQVTANQDWQFDGMIGVQQAPVANTVFGGAVTATNALFEVSTFSTGNTNLSRLAMQKSGSNTIGTRQTTSSGELLGDFLWNGVNSGGNWNRGCQIRAIQQSAAGTKVPARMDFYTSTAAATNVVLRLYEDGDIRVMDKDLEIANDNVSFLMGAGLDTEMYYNGSTAWYFNSRRVGTADYRFLGGDMVVGGDVDPDSRLHAYKASAGAVTALAETVGTFENNTHAYISLLTPNNVLAALVFGDVDDNDVAQVRYNHANDEMDFVVAAAQKMLLHSTELRMNVPIDMETSQLLLADGAVGAPGLALDSDTDTGLYAVAGGIAMGVSGGLHTAFTVNQMATNVGSAAGPSRTYNGDLDTGTYSLGANRWGVATAGVLGLEVAADGGILMPQMASGANQGASGAGAGELWHDTGDDTVKMGV